MPSAVPTNLQEAVETLLTYWEQDLSTVRAMTEGQILTSAHFATGTFMRNSWCLLWFVGHPHQGAWLKEKPPLVKWFNHRGIREADSMSDEVLRALVAAFDIADG